MYELTATDGDRTPNAARGIATSQRRAAASSADSSVAGRCTAARTVATLSIGGFGQSEKPRASAVASSAARAHVRHEQQRLHAAARRGAGGLCAVVRRVTPPPPPSSCAWEAAAPRTSTAEGGVVRGGNMEDLGTFAV